MSRLLRLEIQESAKDLKAFLLQECEGRLKERIQASYLYQTGQACSLDALSAALGRSTATLKNWFRRYRQAGLSGLLTLQHGGGRQRAMPDPVYQALKARLT